MTAITYTAKRNLAPGGHSFTGTDISADTLSDDFKSVTTNISGIPNGYSIYITGFTNSVNNGWHTLNAASTSTAISVTTNLTSELAGNTITITDYVHRYGSQYQLETLPAELLVWEKAESAESVSQGGLEQSIMRRIDYGWNFASDYIEDANLPFWREFLHSCMGKEPFLFDAYGTIASADNQQICVINGTPSWTRINRYYWQVRFTVRVLG